jgi:hypothetical protein
VEPKFSEPSLTAASVLKVGVAAVHDDVAFLKVWQQGVDGRVGAFARLDHDHDPPRPFERRNELFGGFGRDKVLSEPWSARTSWVLRYVRLKRQGVQITLHHVPIDV